jgi:putative CocE/NonD family hydrolase
VLKTAIAAAVILSFSPVPVFASDANAGHPYDMKAHYDKTEHMIPMRDGKKMYTAVYSPKDRSTTYPILLLRTPYSVRGYGEDFVPTDSYFFPANSMLEEGYIFAFQDVRGTFMSEGDFVADPPVTHFDDPTSTDDSTDNFDTIDWLVSNVPNHNGRVGQWGGSYMGWTTVMGLIEPHPSLVAASPQASPADMFVGDDVHHNGAFRLVYSFWWHAYAAQSRDEPGTPEGGAPESQPFDYGTPWGYEFFLNAGPTSELNDRYMGGRIPGFQDYVDHPDYDEFWQAMNPLPHIGKVEIPVLHVAGWFDAEDFAGPVSIYREIEKKNPDNQSIFMCGPWKHGGWILEDGSSLGDIDFGSKTSEYYMEHIAAFFAHHLKGTGDWNPSEAMVFETGGNRWHRFDHWPPQDIESREIYFHEDRRLSFETPRTGSANDSYISDPDKPIPFTTGIVTHPGHTWMIEDQRLMSTRPDVLVYSTEPLQEDLTIAGPVPVNLFMSTTGTDADYFVKLIDVYPGDAPDPEPNPSGVRMGGYQMLVGVEVMRAKYRNDMVNPEPMTPNEVTPISFDIWDRFHTFKKGHRIMIQVHSSWFPAYDRNPQKFTNIYTATAADYQKAEQRLHRSSDAPSHLVLPVLTLADR